MKNRCRATLFLVIFVISSINSHGWASPSPTVNSDDSIAIPAITDDEKADAQLYPPLAQPVDPVKHQRVTKAPDEEVGVLDDNVTKPAFVANSENNYGLAGRASHWVNTMPIWMWITVAMLIVAIAILIIGYLRASKRKSVF